MRKYEQTHPWIDFDFKALRRPSPELYLKLGECKSKCEHIAGVPLRPDTAKKLYSVYLSKGVHATTAIEGNTLSEADVLKQIEGKLELPPSREYLQSEIANIIEACNAIGERILKANRQRISVAEIKQLNKLVLRDLSVGDEVAPGEIRGHSVGVMNYRGAPAEDCEYLLERLCEKLNADDDPRKDMAIPNAILKAIVSHLYLAWIHPFGDGNGRTARLVEFQILLSAGVPAPAAHLLSNHYNLTRSEYYRQLQRASESGGDILPFVTYAVAGFLDGLVEQLAYIREQQMDVIWRNYVYERFRSKPGKPEERKRDLVLDLSRKTKDWLPIDKILEVSPRVMAAYSGRTAKTLSRDLNKLVEMGLILKENNSVKANIAQITAFLPPKAS